VPGPIFLDQVTVIDEVEGANQSSIFLFHG
jgi:hypothetical protein